MSLRRTHFDEFRTHRSRRLHTEHPHRFLRDAEHGQPDSFMLMGMANRWVGITIDCTNPTRLASFWSTILDIPVTAEHGDDPGWATIGSRFDDRPRLTFQRVAEPKIGNVRIHLDIEVDDIEAGCRAVENSGGRWSGERHDYDEGVVMVMSDPEDHEFCLVQYFRCGSN